MTADDRLQHIRSSHAPRRYEFDTTQTYCMASDDPTDDCDTCYLLELVLSPAERAEVLAQQVRVLIAAKAQAWRDGYAAAGASDD